MDTRTQHENEPSQGRSPSSVFVHFTVALDLSHLLSHLLSE